MNQNKSTQKENRKEISKIRTSALKVQLDKSREIFAYRVKKCQTFY